MRRHSIEEFYSYTRKWALRVLRIAKVKVDVINRGRLEPGKSYIYVSNHASLFDIPIILGYLPDDVRIMYKRELEKIPIFGWGLKESPFIAINRSDARNAMKSLEEARNSIRQNNSVLIFAEGTRSKDGKIAEFKRGAFALASGTGREIVPVTIVGSFNILSRGSLKINSSNVKLIIDEPVENKEAMTRAEEKALASTIRQKIITNFESN
jgi:1-acyl-sn-glycerol-3-phosphate acyltransferase